jgi:hypothetical protein
LCSPQAAAADFLHDGTADGSQLLEEIFDQVGGSLNELFLDEHADCYAR